MNPSAATSARDNWLLARCMSQDSDSEAEGFSEEPEGSDGELPGQGQDLQPCLSRLATFDPYNQPEELGEAIRNYGAGAPMQLPQTRAQAPMQAQGGQMQVISMAMPAGMAVSNGLAMPAGMPGATMAMPAGMPAGTIMMLVPGGYVSASAQGYVSAALPQAANVPLAPTGFAGAPAAVARGSAVNGSFADRPQPQTVSCTQEADGIFRVRWTVDARKLKGNDKTVVSPPFEIPLKAAGTFKMMINPTPSRLKGGATFRNSNGRGSVQLKCDTASESKVRICFSIGNVPEEPPRGPVEHNFALNGVCGLPKDFAEFDFTKAVDEAAKTFMICLDFL